MTDKAVVIAPAFIDIADADHKQWRADGDPNTVVGGLFAFGDDFKAARQAFASVVWAAIQGGTIDLGDADVSDVGAVRVMAITRKTFAVTDLV